MSLFICITWPNYWSISFSVYQVALHNWGKARWKYHKYWEKCPALQVLLWVESVFQVGIGEKKGSVQFNSVAQSCLTLCNPIDCSMPGLSVHHHPLEFTQNHVHWVSDAIQPPHPLLFLINHVIPFSSCLQFFPASGFFPLSQLFTSGGQSIGVSASAPVLPMNTQDWSPLGWTGWISLQSKGLSRVFSNTTVQKHQFFGTQLSL